MGRTTESKNHHLLETWEQDAERRCREFLSELGLAEYRDYFLCYDRHFIPKPATVIEVGEPNLFVAQPGDEFILSGERDVAIWTILGKRTAFILEPVSIGGINYYLEAKGYGMNGKYLYPELHSEGDLYHGMFRDSAEREYYYAQQVRGLGIGPTQQSVALLEFDTDTFVRYCCVGLQEHWELLDGKGDDTDEATEDQAGVSAALECWKAFQTGGRGGVRRWAEERNVREAVSGIIDGREAGYVIRAVRSPYRVGDLHDPEIVTSQNQEIAKRMGRMARKMLEQGYWNISPNPGNWTKAGELVDFEDVIRYPLESHLAEEDREFRDITSETAHLAFTFGDGSIGLLAPEFREGFAESPASDKEVAQVAQNILNFLRR